MRTRNWSQIWDECEQKREVLQHLETLTRDDDNEVTIPIPPTHQYASSTIRQLLVVTGHLFRDY